MSNNLVWRPPETSRFTLSTDLKFILRKMYGEPVDIKLENIDKPILKAFTITTDDKKLKKEIEYVMGLIDKHGYITLSEEC